MYQVLDMLCKEILEKFKISMKIITYIRVRNAMNIKMKKTSVF